MGQGSRERIAGPALWSRRKKGGDLSGRERWVPGKPAMVAYLISGSNVDAGVLFSGRALVECHGR